MPYTTTVPTTGHVPSQDYAEMQQNFSQIDTSFQVNHVQLATGSGPPSTEGFHTKIQYAAVTSAPTTASGQGGTFIKTSQSKTELFYVRDNLSPNIPLSCIKAFGFFDGTAVSSTNCYNCTVSGSGGNYVITMSANVLNTGAAFVPIVTSKMNQAANNGVVVGINNVNSPAGTFQINCKSLTSSSPVATDIVSFMVLQL